MPWFWRAALALTGKKSTSFAYPCRLQAILHDVALLGAAVGQPSTEGEHGNLETGGTKVTEFLGRNQSCSYVL